MATGVKVHDDVGPQYNDFKLKKLGAKFILYKIDNGLIVTDVLGAHDATYDDFIAHLPPDEPRYAVYDFEYTTKDGRPADKVVFISW